MTGNQYTKRLIDNINQTTENRKHLVNPFTEIRKIGLNNNGSISTLWNILNTWDTDAHLDVLSQFLNIGERLVDHNKGDKVDIAIWQRDTMENQEKISKLIQNYLDNEQLIDVDSKKPIKEFLIEQLDLINDSTK